MDVPGSKALAEALSRESNQNPAPAPAQMPPKPGGINLNALEKIFRKEPEPVRSPTATIGVRG